MDGKYGNKNCTQMGSSAAHRRGSDCPRLPFCRLAAHKLFHFELSGADHRRASPERQGRGPRGCLRRRRELDPRKGFAARAKAGPHNSSGSPHDYASNHASAVPVHVAAQHETCFSTSGSVAAAAGAAEKTLTGSKSHLRTAHLTPFVIAFTMLLNAVVAELADALA